ncbi:MAG: T9SS type A sorting domain-containing protein [Bacteroidota bacterium]
MKTFFLAVCLTALSFVYSQNCNCDVTLTGLSSTSLNLIWASQIAYAPGDTICIPAGTHAGLRFYDFKGTATQPLTFINCNGQVVIDEPQYAGIEFKGSEYIRLTGTGDTGYDRGIKVIGTGGGAAGVYLTALSTDIEVDHIEVDGAGFAGLMAKTDPICSDSLTWRSSGFIMKNLDIHHNVFKNTGGEGIYIGFTKGYKLDTGRNCSGTNVYGHWLEHVHVHHNTLEDIGWDAIQLSLVRTDGKIYDNYIYNYGTENRYFQDFSISFSGGTYEVYNNISINGPLDYGQGFQSINGQSGTKVFNNVIVRPQLHGIFMHPRHDFEDPNEGYYIANNTIIEPERAGTHYNTTLIHPIDPADLYQPQSSVPTYFVNNLIVDPGYDFEGSNTWKQNQESYFDFNERATRDSLLNNIYSNILTRQMDTLGLTDIANYDYSPASSSSAVVDEGSNLSSWGITFDLENLTRPSGTAFDVGAFEYQSSGSTLLANLSPTFGPKEEATTQMRLYPNPAPGSFVLADQKGQSQKLRLQIVQLSGAIVWEKTYQTGAVVDVSSLQKGLYLLRISGEAIEETHRLIIR